MIPRIIEILPAPDSIMLITDAGKPIILRSPDLEKIIVWLEHNRRGFIQDTLERHGGG